MPNSVLYRKSVARAAALILLKCECILYAPDHDFPFRLSLAPLRNQPSDALRLMDMMADIPSHDGTVPAAPLLNLTSWEDILEVMHLNDFGTRAMRQALATYVRGDTVKKPENEGVYTALAQAG